MPDLVLETPPAAPVTPVAPAAVAPVTPAPEAKPAPVTPAPATPAPETLLGSEPKPADEIARLAAEAEAAKAEKLKNETPDEKVAREKAEADAVAAGKIVPEKYSLKAPEGMTVDQVFLDEKLSPILKKNNLTQAGFQEIIDVYAPHLQAQQQKAIEFQQTEAIKGFKQMIKDWGSETMKVLGPKPAEELAHSARAINKLSSDPKALRAILEETGVGNHRLIVEMFIKAGKLLGEDSFPGGAPPAGSGDNSDEAKAGRMFKTGSV